MYVEKILNNWFYLEKVNNNQFFWGNEKIFLFLFIRILYTDDQYLMHGKNVRSKIQQLCMIVVDRILESKA